MEYAIRKADGSIVVGPGWTCEADVMAGYAGFGSTRVYGSLVRREHSAADWQVVHPPTKETER